MKNTNNQCPLCLSKKSIFFSKDRFREYHHCQNCDLIFVPARYHLSAPDEKERYDLHENNPNDSGYRKFLSTLVDPISEVVPKSSKGLDFGSGPEPVMANMLRELGYEMTLYDKFYANDPIVLTQKYDFITCCETIEHFADPKKELELILSILKPGGVLGIKTNLVDDQLTKFDNWHYKRDLTHICFFSSSTFLWISQHYNCKILKQTNSICVFKQGV